MQTSFFCDSSTFFNINSRVYWTKIDFQTWLTFSVDYLTDEINVVNDDKVMGMENGKYYRQILSLLENTEKV